MRSETAAHRGDDAGPEFFLASTSPRRRELLATQGYRFATLVASIEEVPLPGEAPRAYVERMARGKARAGRALLTPGERRPVLGADTEVVMDGRILGKPASLHEARDMLGLLSGRAHTVFSAVALDDGGEVGFTVCETVVRMRALEATEIDAYWATGEPRDKAGAYAIQGLGAAFVVAIEGSYTAVVGLPLCETVAMLAARGISGWQKHGVRA